MLPPFTSAMSRPRGIKGGIAYAAKQQWCIEGEYVTTQQIAQRMGYGHTTAKLKMKTLREQNAPITWAALEKGK